MIEKLGKIVDKKFGEWKGYYFRNSLFVSLMLLSMGILSYIFDNWYMMIVGTIILNILTEYIKSFHCKVLEHCIIFTNLSFVIFGYISMQSLDYLWIVFFISFYCVLELIKEVKNSDKEKRLVVCILIFIITSLFFLYIKMYIITSTILWSIVMVKLLSFLNKSKWL